MATCPRKVRIERWRSVAAAGSAWDRAACWRMVCEEPFRLFFPAAFAAGILGVGMWPLFYAGVFPFYPGIAHARVMTEGFFLAFILGFLGTAAPRMLTAPPLSRAELARLGIPWLALVCLHAANRVVAGDIAFVVLLVSGWSVIRPRHRVKQSLPPPGFVLVAMGMTGALAGGVMLVATGVAPDWVPLAWFWSRLGARLVHYGMVLLPILGVGPFFLPRFAGLRPRSASNDSAEPGPEWLREARLARFCGIPVILSFALDAVGWVTWGGIVRLVAGGGYLAVRMPIWFPWRAGGTLARVVGLAIILLLVGLALAGWTGIGRPALAHVLLLGGFNLIVFCVATWVLFAHSGIRESAATGKFWWLRIAAGLIVLALVTRVSADFLPSLRTTHLVYAAMTWIVGAGIWGLFVLPRVRVPDSE